MMRGVGIEVGGTHAWRTIVMGVNCYKSIYITKFAKMIKQTHSNRFNCETTIKSEE